MPPWEKDNHLQQSLGKEYVSSQKGNYYNSDIFSRSGLQLSPLSVS